MREREHLTKNQIAGYRAGAFNDHQSREIGRHLLKCEFCRKSLPAPTFDDFWSAVMTERETEQTSASDESEFSRHSLIFSFPKTFKGFSSLAWSGAALMVLASLSLLLWLNAAQQPNQEKEIAQTFNSEIVELDPAQNENGEQIFPSPPGNSKNENQGFSAESNRPLKTKLSKTNPVQNNQRSSSPDDFTQNSAKRVLKNKPENISSTRGGSDAKCVNESAFETETLLSGKDVILEWEKVPNVVKYSLYVSDEEEILIDEFETVKGTSYVLKKPLDPLKTYKWKVVVTLENGNTINGDSRKFTVKDLKSDQKKSVKKEKSDIRCSENK